MDPYTKLLQDALDKWGFGTQALIAIEEMAELIQALAKRDRTINPSSHEDVCRELADVDLCLDQMKLIFPEYGEYKTQAIKKLRGLVARG